jgi:hypothetical protein
MYLNSRFLEGREMRISLNYKKLENKKNSSGGRFPRPKKAMEIVNQSIIDYKKKFGK